MDNVLERARRREVERFSEQGAREALDDDAAEQAPTLSGLPTAAQGPDEAAQRFDILILRRQLGQLEGDAVTAEHPARRSAIERQTRA